MIYTVTRRLFDRESVKGCLGRGGGQEEETRLKIKEIPERGRKKQRKGENRKSTMEKTIGGRNEIKNA